MRYKRSKWGTVPQNGVRLATLLRKLTLGLGSWKYHVSKEKYQYTWCNLDFLRYLCKGTSNTLKNDYTLKIGSVSFHIKIDKWLNQYQYNYTLFSRKCDVCLILITCHTFNIWQNTKYNVLSTKSINLSYWWPYTYINQSHKESYS